MSGSPAFLNRRSFVKLAGWAYAARSAFGQSEPAAYSAKDYPITVGRVVWVGNGQTAEEVVREVHDLGLSKCQIGFDDLSLQTAVLLRQTLDKYGVEATAISEHNPGPRIFNFYEGPLTIGIIPPATRKARIRALKLAAEVASRAGIPSIHTHCGFIPEDPNDHLYPQAVAAVREVAAFCKEHGVSLLCETGQETPVTLMRMIRDVNLSNVFVNLDVANLILYGKGNPVDAMEVFGSCVRGIHAKDGLFPTNTRELGLETLIGNGKVDFASVLRQLKQTNYKGSMMIEQESGDEDQRTSDVLHSKDLLEKLIMSTYLSPQV